MPEHEDLLPTAVVHSEKCHLDAVTGMANQLLAPVAMSVECYYQALVDPAAQNESKMAANHKLADEARDESRSSAAVWTSEAYPAVETELVLPPLAVTPVKCRQSAEARVEYKLLTAAVMAVKHYSAALTQIESALPADLNINDAYWAYYVSWLLAAMTLIARHNLIPAMPPDLGTEAYMQM